LFQKIQISAVLVSQDAGLRDVACFSTFAIFFSFRVVACFSRFAARGMHEHEALESWETSTRCRVSVAAFYFFALASPLFVFLR
jgi:hypothetical protein